MCLHFYTRTPTHQGKRTVWKVLILKLEKLMSPFYRHHIWKPGTNQSNRISTDLRPHEESRGEIGRGFHVYTRCPMALWEVSDEDAVTVEVTVDSEDFVAESVIDGEAVYTKVILSEEEYTRAMKKG